ncbi:hypothetical protein ZIOFF_043563 [Zingiber officinale]|uniref:HMG box domain-containing protein n=1 Tax=Zingiber officinale TaxID=94328 RepID=A0A8J5GAT7_ZINOF|nr:hypothetical protein ZIOFF_043563 [Zingiber officinale]
MFFFLYLFTLVNPSTKSLLAFSSDPLRFRLRIPLIDLSSSPMPNGKVYTLKTVHLADLGEGWLYRTMAAMENLDVAKAGGDKWKSLTEEKAPYVASAAKLKADYTKTMVAYNKGQSGGGGGSRATVVDEAEEEGEESDKSKSEVNDDDEDDDEEEV